MLPLSLRSLSLLQNTKKCGQNVQFEETAREIVFETFFTICLGRRFFKIFALILSSKTNSFYDIPKRFKTFDIKIAHTNSLLF